MTTALISPAFRPLPRARTALVTAAVIAIAATLAACSPAADDDTTQAGGQPAETSEGSTGAGDPESTDAGDDAEPESADVRDTVTSIRETFDNVVEATSDTGVLVAAGINCPEEGTPFMLIGARGLTGDAEYVAETVPEVDFELRAVAQPDGTFRMQSDADPDVSSYTITLATIGSGVTLDVPGCAN
ncbi:hypothetical protein [Demequina aestuarii]|uniref:hypothetical protein n=1 Tax=Demequina aestuarii TaxID=327095 RepID=UPI0007848C1D|nr:hypothetical protein [Demequina aestuarii]